MRHLILLCCLLACAGVQAQTYKWTDSSGRTVVSDTPPPGKTRAAARSDDKPAAGDNLPFATKQAMEKYPVVLYTAADCSSECKSGRDQLNGRGIPFTEKAVQTPEELAELKQLVGDAFVPSLKVGRQSHRGYEAGAWDSLLDMAGYPKTAPYGSKKAEDKK